MVCFEHRAAALPHAGAGPAAEDPRHAVDLPPGTIRSDHTDGGCPVLRTGADSRQSRGLCILFLAQEPLRFRDCGLGGIWEWSSPWFDWTYGTYLVVLAGLILALSLAAAGLTMFLSQYSGSYIAMLLKALPLFAAVGAALGSWLLDQPFCFRRLWEGGPWVPRGTEAAVAAGLLAVSIVLCVLTCRRQRKRELL